MFIYDLKIYLILVTTLIPLLLFVETVDAIPYGAGLLKVNPTEKTYCETETEIETLCQKCAKVTKSPVVYPWCCTKKEEAYEFCDRYIRYGLQK